MSTQPSQLFQFEGYTVRPITEQDRAYLEEQIAGDPLHKDRMDADYFIKLLPGESAWALEENGQIVFYFKNSPAVRISIQFANAGRRKNMLGLMKGLVWIENIFRASFFREIIFDTEGPDLMDFAKKHLGFRDAPNLLRRLIHPQVYPAAQPMTRGNGSHGQVRSGGIG